MSLQSTDPIADLLTRIRNAAMVGKHEIRVPSSKLKVTVAQQLKKNRYLTDVKVEAGVLKDTLGKSEVKVFTSNRQRRINAVSPPATIIAVAGRITQKSTSFLANPV